MKKSTAVIIGVMGLILAAAGLLFSTRRASSNQQKREEIASIFEVYQQYGLTYNKKDDRLYYNNELVRYFEDIVNEDNYKEWPHKDGTVDVYAVRNESGKLVGVEPFDQQAFADRTPLMKDSIYELQITQSISNSVDGYTKDIEEQVKYSIESAYEIYQPYGLTYDRESDRLYYEGELVGYFEDKELAHTFGPFDDSEIIIYALRDKQGKLEGLEVEGDVN